MQVAEVVEPELVDDTQTRLGPSVSATASARSSSTTGEPVGRTNSPYSAAICTQSHGASASNEAGVA